MIDVVSLFSVIHIHVTILHTKNTLLESYVYVEQYSL